MTAPAILWFRRDLRLDDNPALAASLAAGAPVIPLYVLDDTELTEGPGIGAASRWWLHGSLGALAAALAETGSRLILRRGEAGAILRDLARETGAKAVYWNRLYDPVAIQRDTTIKTMLTGAGLRVESHAGALIREPWALKTGQGSPYAVFTPFWNALRPMGPDGPPIDAPVRMPAPPSWPASDALADWSLTPSGPDWAAGLRETWTPGEEGAGARLGAFLAAGLTDYASARDRPAIPGTSALSPHLHFGELSPRRIWTTTLDQAAPAGGRLDSATWAFLRELGWRDFSHHLMFHRPEMHTGNLRPVFDAFPWRDAPEDLAAWRRGRTGYPFVDAGMRQLWRTGWMHNRVRMVVGSFLVKHLLIHWSAGERWFWDTLVDADHANNPAGWQWVAGSGADAAPYFRVFNPVTQGEKFDADGAYTRRFVPELARMPDKWLHKPWEAPPHVLEDAGVRLGETYPAPIVDHRTGRQRALEAYETIKGKGGGLAPASRGDERAA